VSLVICAVLKWVLSCFCFLCSIKVTEQPTQCFINFNQVNGCTLPQTIKTCKAAPVLHAQIIVSIQRVCPGCPADVKYLP
jgi:hypothetical protein